MAFNFSLSLPRNGALLCLRNLDDESGLDAEAYDRVIDVVEKRFPNCRRTNNLNKGDADANILRDMRREIVTAELAKFAASQVVITDRLHGLIFSIIARTPCVVMSAFNQKISEFCEFFMDSDGVLFIDKNIDSLGESIESALRIGDPKYPILDSDYWDRLYHAIWES